MLPSPAGREASSGGGVLRYERHRPERTLLYQLVQEYYPALKAQLAAQGTELPGYVQREFEAYLNCGRLEQGFLRLRCDTCHNDVEGGNGPSLAGLYGSQVSLNGGSAVADESYIRESILDPRQKIVSGFGTIMPTFQGQISEEQVFELIAYIKTLEVQ